MDKTLYWIWLQGAISRNAGAKANHILSVFKSLREFYEAGLDDWRLLGIFTEKELEKLKNNSLDYSERILDKCKKLGYNVLTPEDEKYPSRLLCIYDYPCALYVWGDMGDIDDEVCISIVGTRNASPYGLQVAYNLALGLAKAGAVVVSGAALGIDTKAHEGALAAGGRTIAVLGCGINYNYLNENKELRRTISNNGAVISEYPPDTEVRPYHFPVRNRIISGLSLGTVVVEARRKSGALITASLSAEHGKDVFAVPGSIMSEYSDGANKLLSDGAKPVSSAVDILEEYTHLYPHKIDMLKAEAFSRIPSRFIREEEGQNQALVAQPPVKIQKEETAKQQKKQPPENLSSNALKVYSAIDFEPIHVDDIQRKVSLKTFVVLQSLTELELAGLITPLSGRRYCAVTD